MKIEDIFNEAENGTLTLEQFTSIASGKSAKFVDLSEGNYISVQKHNSEINAKDKQIETLNDNISTRDVDLANLQNQLKEAGTDATKLSELQTDFDSLQIKYDNDVKAFQQQLTDQARDFAIREHANGKKFSSPAAKRDYIRSMKESEDIKFNKKGQLVGMDSFDADYAEENAESFVTEPEQSQQEEQQQNGSGQLPMFAQQTPGEPFKEDTGSGFGFSFIPQQES